MNDLAVILEQRAAVITNALDEHRSQLTQAREVCDRLSAEVDRLVAALEETQRVQAALAGIRGQ